MYEMTQNGISTTTEPEQEKYVWFYTRLGRYHTRRLQYDFRYPDGRLFTGVFKSLDEARAAREKEVAYKRCGHNDPNKACTRWPYAECLNCGRYLNNPNTKTWQDEYEKFPF